MLIGVELTAKSTPHVEIAIGAMTHGVYARRFWAGGVVLGLVVPAAITVLALAADTGALWPAIAGLAAVIGMWFYEDSFVRAGQSVPLS
jgi:hypothetical protein